MVARGRKRAREKAHLVANAAPRGPAFPLRVLQESLVRLSSVIILRKQKDRAALVHYFW